MSRAIESLMRHDVPRRTHRKAKHAWRTSAPRCDVCRKQEAPGIDHSRCKA